MSGSRLLGGLQLAILRVLWERGEATAAQVHEELLPEKRLALTTIATMLSKLERKGLVRHRPEGRQYVYRAAAAEEEIHRSMVAEFVERLFPGNPAALVNHLLSECEIDFAELDQLRALIALRQELARKEAADG
ncbi:MAG: BlaI/MecI/CopY family transcriptional regulator [Planctomycetes bacterium]|nr:BlaI/MecI/CopY family transcriptional regulator [Planctomycetota bacterium]